MPKGTPFVFGQVPFGDIVRDQTHRTANLPFGKIAHFFDRRSYKIFRGNSCSLETAPALLSAAILFPRHVLMRREHFQEKKIAERTQSPKRAAGTKFAERTHQIIENTEPMSEIEPKTNPTAQPQKGWKHPPASGVKPSIRFSRKSDREVH